MWQFVDLLAVTNISCFLMEEKYYSHYPNPNPNPGLTLTLTPTPNPNPNQVLWPLPARPLGALPLRLGHA